MRTRAALCAAQVWTYHNQVALVVSVIDSHEVHNQTVAKQLLQQAGLKPGLPASMQPPLTVQQQHVLAQVGWGHTVGACCLEAYQCGGKKRLPAV